MSLIPNNAISSSLSPVQRSTNDQIVARKVQSKKDFHHSEEVDELEDTAVNSVRDQRQGRGNQKDPDKRKDAPDEPEEKVEIAALSETPPERKAKSPRSTPRNLDISA